MSETFNPEIHTSELKKAREELEVYIPPDLAAKFPQADFARLNPEAQQLLEEISLRSGQGDPEADLLFAKIVALNKEKYSGQELTKEEKDFLEGLKKEAESKREKLAETIRYFEILPKKTLNQLISKHDWSAAGSLAEKFLAAGEKETAKQILDQLISKGDWSAAGSLAGKLLAAGEKDILPQAKQTLDQLMSEGDEWRATGSLAGEFLKAGEKDILPQIIQLDFNIG